MSSTSWVVTKSEQQLKHNIVSTGQQKLKDNIYSKSIITRRLKFVRPKKQCNTRPMSSSSSTSSSSTPPNPGRQHSDFNAPSRHLFSESDAQSLMKWSSTSSSQCSVGSGLRNLGNSCFMNATLQCLCYTPAFQNYIASNQHSKLCKTAGYCIFCELQKLMPEMINSESTAVPSKVFRNLRALSKTLRPGRQEDAQEFLRYLMEGLQNSALKHEPRKIKDSRIEETTLIHKLWGGYLRSQIKCCKCGAESNTYDAILDISLEIKGPSIHSAFKHFTDPEILDDDNKYFCDNCKKKRRAIKQLTIFEAPNILILHLKRFESNNNGFFSGGKINKHVKFTELLDITEFMSYSIDPKVTYDLFGVLIHYGYSSHGGHYVSYIKSIHDGNWYLMDDSRVTGPTRNIQKVLDEKAYLLFYKRNETKILYESPANSPIKTRTNRNKSLQSTFDSLHDLVDVLPSKSPSPTLSGKRSRNHTFTEPELKRSRPTSKENSSTFKNSSRTNKPLLSTKNQDRLRKKSSKDFQRSLSTIKSSRNQKHQSVDNQSDHLQEWQKNLLHGEMEEIETEQEHGNGRGMDKKRKLMQLDSDLISKSHGSPTKKRKIVQMAQSVPIQIMNQFNGNKLKLLKQKRHRNKKNLTRHTYWDKRASSSSPSSSPQSIYSYPISSTNTLRYLKNKRFVGRRSNTLRLAAQNGLKQYKAAKKIKNWDRRISKRATQLPLTSNMKHLQKWNRNSKTIALSDSSSESVFSDNRNHNKSNPNSLSPISDCSVSLSPEMHKINENNDHNTTLPNHDRTSPRSLPITSSINMNNNIYNNSTNLKSKSVPKPAYFLKDIAKETNNFDNLPRTNVKYQIINSCDEIQSFLNNESSKMSATGIGNVELWTNDINKDEIQIRNNILNNYEKPLIEPKDEWDDALDSNMAYPKKPKQKSNPWKHFDRDDKNQFQVIQTDPNGYHTYNKYNAHKKRKYHNHNKIKYQQRQRINV